MEARDSEFSGITSSCVKLANAATSDRNKITTLTNTNAQLCKEIAATNSKLADALERLENKQNPTENRTRYYCWSCGSRSNHPSGECTNKKRRTRRHCKFLRQKGGSDKMMYHKRWHSGSVCENNKYENLINHTHCNTLKQLLAIANSGCTSHFLCDASNFENIQPAGANAITATIPNGEKIWSTHTTTLKWPHIPPSERTCHIFPALKNNILLSIGQFCDAGLNSAFTKLHLYIYDRSTIFSKEKGNQETECGTSTYSHKHQYQCPIRYNNPY